MPRQVLKNKFKMPDIDHVKTDELITVQEEKEQACKEVILYKEQC